MPKDTFPEQLLEEPFFFDANDTEWNACIGRQSQVENYLDGYIGASVVLVDGMIENKSYRDRDTLVLPILYCARHGVELLLKYAVDALADMNVLRQKSLPGHDLMRPFNQLQEGSLGDRELIESISGLTPFVEALHQMDESGQGLRYSENRAGEQNLQDRSIINLRVVRASLIELRERVEGLVDSLDRLSRERATQAFTAACSRQDLMSIAKRLPPRKLWGSKAFDAIKSRICAEYDLSSNKFGEALEVIKKNRAMRSRLGEESSPVHLSEEQAIKMLGLALERRAFYQKYSNGTSVITREDILQMLGNQEDAEFDKAQLDVLRSEFPKRSLADINALYYLGRNREFPEYYERNLGFVLAKYERADDVVSEFYDVFCKTNLSEGLIDGIQAIGATSLAAQLRERSKSVA